MMESNIIIRPIEKDDTQKILEVLTEPYMIKRSDYYRTYFNSVLEENSFGKRITLVAFAEDVVAGYVNVIYKSKYPYFEEKNIPEINDLYVVPKHRKNGIGRMLILECEKAASAKFDYIGLGVGLYSDYGSAQRLYARLGYIPDGNGLMYENNKVTPGNNVFVDDDLLLYLYKKLG